MKVLMLMPAVLMFFTAATQITTTKIAEAPPEPEKHYDSTQNFLGSNARQYIGVELYLKGLPQNQRQNGYSSFVIDYNKSITEKENIYNCCSGEGSNYAALAGKYFTVLDVIKHPKAAEDEDLYGSKFFLKLEEKGTKDIVYWLYDTSNYTTFPFVATGYFVKYKQEVVGKKYIVKGKNWFDGEGKPMRDVKTGLPVADFEPGKIWQAVDLTIEEKYFTLALVLENDLHEQVTLPVDDLKSTQWVFDYDKADEYQKKLGNPIWQLVLQGKVQKGMNKYACELAWGKSSDIVTTNSKDAKPLELWNYDNHKLYFADGILFDWQ